MFLRRLERRLQDVEGTVDAHVASLLRAASKKKATKSIPDAQLLAQSKFKGYSCMQKLKLLVANNKMLVAYYSAQPEENRCLRMQGVTQSYD